MRSKVAKLSDAELALLARDGNAAAFEEIYDRHAPGVARALASFVGGDTDSLEDLVQEVFFRVIDGIASYVPERPFPNWLYTVALNTGRNHVRDHAMELPVDPSELDSMPLVGNESVDCPDDLIGARLLRLVTALPEELREVVFLRIGADLAYGEIGEILGIPEGTARSRMHNAIANLRERLGVANPESKKERP
ncbi:MAG: RNA polymerase sigma factor [Candidatus Krumholzibacteriaceae bacterium]